MDEKGSLWVEIDGKKLFDISVKEDLNRLLSEADDPKVVRHLTSVKNLYAGDTLEEEAARVGKSESTGSRWARRWNEGGLGQLTPNFGDGVHRSSAKMNKNSWLRCFVRVSSGNHRKFSISSTRNLTSNTTQSI